MRLGDGSSLRETLTQLDLPNAFLYSLDQITSPLRMLVGGLHGRWSFRELSDAEGRPMTLAQWHYTFEPHSWLTWLPSFLIVKGFWRIYMAKTLERATAQAVGGGP